MTGSGSVYYYHADQIGSTRALTESTGALQDTWAYDPYGNVTSSTGSVANPFQFQGQYLDSTSAFYYLRTRWYDQGTAQFVSPDPLRSITRDIYAYAADGPLSSADWTGLDKDFWQRLHDLGDIIANCMFGSPVECVGGSVVKALEPISAGGWEQDEGLGNLLPCQGTVDSIVAKYGIDFHGVNPVFRESKGMPSTISAGTFITSTGGIEVDVYRNAFSSEERLARALMEESVHVQQIHTYGADYYQTHPGQMEAEARLAVDEWWGTEQRGQQ